ncbi:MAG TPA: DUF2059 domain-containing protein [Allosphingosinicella sp.]|nr:DUF2059 domain-containing protein [Allosphingosinicella sp.]
MRTVAIFLAGLAAAPGAAQTVAPPPAVAPAEAIEPARLEAARATVERLWPLGTYERMMRGSMSQMTDAVMASMADVKMGDMVGPSVSTDGKPLPPEADMTFREIMAKSDPHFLERAQITNRVMMEEMIPTMARLEPQVREALARVYARRFTAEQLGDMTRFFSTPSGAAFAREWMMVMTDKEMVLAMASMGPAMLRDMPRIMEKAKAATAHLPPPKLTPPPMPTGKR